MAFQPRRERVLLVNQPPEERAETVVASPVCRHQFRQRCQLIVKRQAQDGLRKFAEIPFPPVMPKMQMPFGMEASPFT